MTDDELMRSAKEAIDLLTYCRNKLYGFANGELEAEDGSITVAQLQTRIVYSLDRGEYVVDMIRAAHPEEMENRSGNFFDKAFWIYDLCDDICASLFWDEIAEDTEKEM